MFSSSSPRILRAKASDIYNLKFRRAGIIPYIKVEGINYYGLFIDSHFHEITEAAGRVNKDEHFIDGAIRECNEESLGIFDFTHFREHLITNCYCYSNNQCVIIFVQIKGVKNTMINFRNEFRDRYEKNIISIMNGEKVLPDIIENCFMCWLPENTVRSLTFQMVNQHFDCHIKEIFYASTEILKSKCLSILLGKNNDIFNRHFDTKRDTIKLFNITKTLFRLIYFSYGNLSP